MSEPAQNDRRPSAGESAADGPSAWDTGRGAPGAERGTPSGDIVPRSARFNFGCPRCESLLESERRLGGQNGRCPTCGARFVIPRAGEYWTVQLAELLDPHDQDPTPIHAYAASGTQAPHLLRLAGDRLEIECPRCSAHCDVAANNCPSCGVPFTMDGVPRIRPPMGDAVATVAVIMGVLALPLSSWVVPGALALLLALASWMRSGRSAPCARAIAAAILGLVALALAWAMPA